MIRVNLARGERRTGQASGIAPRLRFAKPGRSAGAPSKWRMIAITAWLVSPMIVGWMHLAGARERSELDAALSSQRVDSVRYAAMHAANAALRAREDSIRGKLAIIEEIDAGRFVWAHVIDELSFAVPDYVWLTNVLYVSSEAGLHAPRFSIEGRSGSTYALAEFLRNLEASAFLQDITLMGTSRVMETDVYLHSFVIEARYRTPPDELVEKVRVFAEGVD